MNTQTKFEPAPIPDGITELDNGQQYMTDATGKLVPLGLVKPQHKLEDEQVRKIMGFAIALSEQVARFKIHTMADLAALDALLEQDHNFVKRGNRGKGNRTYMTVDGLFKVSVQVADLIDFGPKLQVAKGLIDECLNEWAADSRPEIQAVVQRAFNTDKEGQINRSEIFMLLRLKIEDARWREAMSAIEDAIRIVGSKEYVRFGMRARTEDPWQTVKIDLAKA